MTAAKTAKTEMTPKDIKAANWMALSANCAGVACLDDELINIVIYAGSIANPHGLKVANTPAAKTIDKSCEELISSLSA